MRTENRWFRLNLPHLLPAPTLGTKGACSPLWSRFTNVIPGVILEGGWALGIDGRPRHQWRQGPLRLLTRA